MPEPVTRRARDLMRSFFTLLFLMQLLLNPSKAFAADVPTAQADTTVIETDKVCGLAFSPTKLEIKNALSEGEAWSHVSSNPSQTIVVWTARSEDGFYSALAFQRPGAKWIAQKIAIQSSVVGSKATSTGAFAVFTMWSSGGPGLNYDVISSPDGSSKPLCSEVAFPTELNKPDWNGEYLTFLDFNGKSGNIASLIGEFATDREMPPPYTHYKYDTTDGGKTWSTPIGLKSNMTLSGDYFEMKRGIPDDILDALPVSIN